MKRHGSRWFWGTVFILLLGCSLEGQAARPAAPGRVDPPRMVVLPFRPLVGAHADRSGLALHFLLGNLIPLNPALKEFWFGWRVPRLFPEKTQLRAYVEGTGDPVDVPRLAAEQGIRYWLEGTVRPEGPVLTVDLEWIDAQRPDDRTGIRLSADPDQGLLGFRREFLEWMAGRGLRFPPQQAPRVLWPEKTSRKGLASLGAALEAVYVYSYGKPAGPLPLEPFQEALRTAPRSYLARDLLGWALYRNEDYPGARHHFLQALQSNPDGIGALAGLMWCAVKTGKEAEAYAWGALRASSRARPLPLARAEVANRLGNEASGRKDNEGAIAFYQEAVAANPDKPLYVGKLIRSTARAGRFERGRQIAERTVDWFSDPDDRKTVLLAKAELLYDEARFLNNAGRCHEAVPILEAALRIERRYREKRAENIAQELSALPCR